MRQILCVRLLNWPIDSLSRKSPWREGNGAAFVAVRSIANRREVIAASVAAWKVGIRPGMTLAHAQALCADLAHDEHDPARDAKKLAALARWMTRFSPLVCPVHPSEDGPLDHAIFLDVTGCQGIFRGLAALMRQAAAAMRRWRISARLAIAPTAGAAWAMTQTRGRCFSSSPGIPGEDRGGGSNAAKAKPPPQPSPGIPEEGENGILENLHYLPTALAPLPVSALRISPQCALSLHQLGIQTIGQLAQLPRSVLPARFGEEVLIRLDQAMGRLAEPLVFLPHQAAVRAREDFDGPIDAPESLWAVLQRLIERILIDLKDRGCGARRMEVDFFRPHASPIHKTILLSRPTRDGKKLLGLIQCAMEQMENVAPARETIQQIGGRSYVLLPPRGFVGIRLIVSVMEKWTDEQLHLLDQTQRIGKVQLDDLLERLALRLGPQGVLRPQFVESHLPEKAIRAIPASDLEMNDSPPSAAPPRGPRPLQMLPMPSEIRVIAAVAAEEEGRPASFAAGGVTHRIIHAVGPERISGQWWQGHDKTRDYFDVEDTAGQRFWIFRVAENSRWFLHGKWG